MALFQYVHNETPLGVELTSKNIFFHRLDQKKSISIKDINSISIAYWGSENIEFKKTLEESLQQLLKVEIGTACLFVQSQKRQTIDHIEISNSNQCLFLMKFIIEQHPNLWKGIAPYATLCKVLQIKESWTFLALAKVLLKYLVFLYLLMCLLIGLKYSMQWLQF